MSHTPGPWVIDEDGRVMQSSNGANVSGLVVRRMTTEDAYLIAAAPDLLAALKMVLDYSELPASAIRERAVHAIKKAERREVTHG